MCDFKWILKCIIIFPFPNVWFFFRMGRWYIRLVAIQSNVFPQVICFGSNLPRRTCNGHSVPAGFALYQPRMAFSARVIFLTIPEQFLHLPYNQNLTHWARLTHICVSKLTIIGSDNGMSPDRRQAIIRTNAGILLIRTTGTNVNEILCEDRTFSLEEMRVKISYGKGVYFGSASMC